MEVRKEDHRDQIEIERIRDFKNHPFKVQADSQMKELQESIKKYGILNPLIVRPRPGEICKMPLEFGLLVPDGYAGFIFPKSGLSSQGIVCELPPIDSSYTGEVHAIISNVGNTAYEIKADDKIGQLMILPIVIPDFTYEL